MRKGGCGAWFRAYRCIASPPAEKVAATERRDNTGASAVGREVACIREVPGHLRYTGESKVSVPAPEGRPEKCIMVRQCETFPTRKPCDSSQAVIA